MRKPLVGVSGIPLSTRDEVQSRVPFSVLSHAVPNALITSMHPKEAGWGPE